jgi:hypothetical protein
MYAPFSADTLPLLSLSGFYDIGGNTQIRLQEKVQPKIFVHQCDGGTMYPYISARLQRTVGRMKAYLMS